VEEREVAARERKNEREGVGARIGEGLWRARPGLGRGGPRHGPGRAAGRVDYPLLALACF
jgi:hypothetical protein